MTILKISILCIIGVILIHMLRQGKSEYAGFISIGICIILLLYSARDMEAVFTVMKEMKSACGNYEPYFVILVKMIGITFISDFTMGICKEAGLVAVAGTVDMITRVLLCIVGLPVIEIVISMISEL